MPHFIYNFIQISSKEEVDQFLSSYIFLNPPTPRQRHTNLFKLSCGTYRRGCPQESILRGITTCFEHTDFAPKEIKNILLSGYQKVASASSKENPSSATSAQNDKTTKATYGTSKMNDETNEAYWQGKEFRKQTLCFPE